MPVARVARVAMQCCATYLPTHYYSFSPPLPHITGVRTGGEDGAQRRQLQSRPPARLSAQAPLERLGGK